MHIASATDNYLNLEFTRHKVMVKGKFLAKISRAIAAHRLAYLRESGGNPMAPDGAPAIDKITFVAKDGSTGNLIQQIAGECNEVEELTQYQS